MAKKIHVVIQEGGSTREVYAHAYNTLKQARAMVKSCAEASYNTAGPITLPPYLTETLLKSVALEIEFYKFLDDVVQSVKQL